MIVRLEAGDDAVCVLGANRKHEALTVGFAARGVGTRPYLLTENKKNYQRRSMVRKMYE